MLEDTFKIKYERELSELELISQQIRSEYDSSGYVDTFPKTCFRCQSVYRNADEFYKHTKPCNTETTTVQSRKGFEKELRFCRCGATLVSLSMSDRRNLSEAGARRRALFDEWYEKLVESAQESEGTRIELRAIFRMFEEERIATNNLPNIF